MKMMEAFAYMHLVSGSHKLFIFFEGLDIKGFVVDLPRQVPIDILTGLYKTYQALDLVFTPYIG